MSVPTEDVAIAQDPIVVAVGVGQDSKAQAISLVAVLQKPTTPLVKSPHPDVTSEITIPGIVARSETIDPFSMSSKTLTTSVSTACAASKISVGKEAAILRRPWKVPIISWGRSLMRSGVWPSSS